MAEYQPPAVDRSAGVQRYYAAVREWHTTYFNHPTRFLDVTRNDKKEVVTINPLSEISLLVAEVGLIIWPLLSTQEHYETLWRRLTIDENTVPRPYVEDYILNGTSFMLSMVPQNPTADSNTLSVIYSSLGWVSKSKCVSSTISDRAADSSKIEELLKNEPWVIFLMILSMIDTNIKGLLERT